MQLEVEEIKALEPIKFNYEELKKYLTEKVKEYKNIVYTEDNIKLAKDDRAKLNKIAKAINDEKIRIKNCILEDYTTNFEPKCKELIDLIKEASTHADAQIKSYEQQLRDDKLQVIVNFFIENVGNYKDLIDFDNIYNERWLNATYKMEQIQNDILHIFSKTTEDMPVIDNEFKDDNINKQVKAYYFKNISNPSVLSLSRQEGLKISENNKKLEELKQKEEETQNQTKTIQNVPKSEESLQNNANLRQIDFRVCATNEQLKILSEFLKKNNIKYGPVNYAKINKNDLVTILQYCNHMARLISPANAEKYGLIDFDGAINDFIGNVIYNIENDKEINLSSKDEENFDVDIFKRIQESLKNLESK